MNKIIKCMWMIAFSFVMLCQPFVLAGQGEKEGGAKALFYDPATGTALKSKEKVKDAHTGRIRVKQTQGASAKYSGLHYWIELEGAGPVTDDRVFHTGEAIRLHIRSNVDGYLSLWSLDSSGRGTQLFPGPKQPGADNYVKADSEYVTPGLIRFAPPVEDERLLVFFSRSKTATPAPAGTSSDGGPVAKMLGNSGAKALVFETEKNDSAEVGTYVVSKNGGSVAKEIRLRHQP
jgi:hypothetical protein